MTPWQPVRPDARTFIPLPLARGISGSPACRFLRKLGLRAGG